MNVSHVAGGGFGALIGAALAGLLNKYTSVSVSDVDASVIGSTAIAAGIGVGHVVGKVGVKGLLVTIWRGSQKPTTSSLA